MKRTLDITATTLLALACVAVIGDVAWRHAFARVPPTRAAGPRAVPPDQLAWLSQTGFSLADRTVALVIRESCRYCTDSMPFYRELGGVQRVAPFRLVAVTTDSHERCEAFLRTHDLAVDGIVVVPPERLGVEGTPTLLVVARSGKVEHFAKGQLDAQGQKAVVDLLTEGAAEAAGHR